MLSASVAHLEMTLAAAAPFRVMLRMMQEKRIFQIIDHNPTVRPTERASELRQALVKHAKRFPLSRSDGPCLAKLCPCSGTAATGGI